MHEVDLKPGTEALLRVKVLEQIMVAKQVAGEAELDEAYGMELAKYEAWVRGGGTPFGSGSGQEREEGV